MKESTGKMLMGVIIGAAVGAIAGILFAPDKGSVTRKKISDKAQETGENIKETVSGKIEEVKDFVSEKVDKMKHKKTNHHGATEYHEETAEPNINV
jgi:gas vesicle protein